MIPINPLLSFSPQISYRPVQVPVAGIPEDPSPSALEGRVVEKEGTGAQDKISRRRNFDTYECQTCRERKYKDGSDDPGVSFKTPAHISPENTASAIRAHEYEHVSHNRAQAQREGKEILSQSVTYHTDVCPECGRVYMSGGTTRTVFASSQDPYGQEQGAEQKGVYLDMIA